MAIVHQANGHLAFADDTRPKPELWTAPKWHSDRTLSADLEAVVQ